MSRPVCGKCMEMILEDEDHICGAMLPAPCPRCGDPKGDCEERARSIGTGFSELIAAHDMTRAAIILACAITGAFKHDPR